MLTIKFFLVRFGEFLKVQVVLVCLFYGFDDRNSVKLDTLENILEKIIRN